MQMTRWKRYTNRKRQYKTENPGEATANKKIKKRAQNSSGRITFLRPTQRNFQERLENNPLKEPPTMKEVDDFWEKNSINEKEGNKKAEWIKREEEGTKKD